MSSLHLVNDRVTDDQFAALEELCRIANPELDNSTPKPAVHHEPPHFLVLDGGLTNESGSSVETPIEALVGDPDQFDIDIVEPEIRIVEPEFPSEVFPSTDWRLSTEERLEAGRHRGDKTGEFECFRFMDRQDPMAVLNTTQPKVQTTETEVENEPVVAPLTPSADPNPGFSRRQLKQLSVMMLVASLLPLILYLRTPFEIARLRVALKRGETNISSSKLSGEVLSRIEILGETVRTALGSYGRDNYSLAADVVNLKAQLAVQKRNALLTMSDREDVISLVTQSIRRVETGKYDQISLAESPRTTPPRGQLAPGLKCHAPNIYCDYAYGAAQVMGDNIPSWSLEFCKIQLTPAQWITPKYWWCQAAVQRGQIGKYLDASVSDRMPKGDVRKPVASWHNRLGDYNSLSADSLGTTTRSYVEKVMTKICPIRPDLCDFPEPDWKAFARAAIQRDDQELRLKAAKQEVKASSAPKPAEAKPESVEVTPEAKSATTPAEAPEATPTADVPATEERM